MLVEDEVAEGLDEKRGGYEDHEGKEDLVGPGGEFYALDGHESDEADCESGEDGERNFWGHALNGEDGVECVLDGLEKIFEEHGPADDEADVGIESFTDVGVDGAGRRVDGGHAAEADGGDRHGDHGEEQCSDGVAVGENLRFAEERDSGDGGSEDDTVVDQIPEAKDAFQVGLRGGSRFECPCDCFHAGLFRMRKDFGARLPFCDSKLIS